VDSGAVRSWVGRARPWVAGLTDQALWSVNSFLLTMVAGRTIGPEGLGAVTIGFTTVLVALGLQRNFLLEPFLAAPPRQAEDDLKKAVLTMSLGAGVLAELLCGATGLLLHGTARRALLGFTPFLVAVLIQDALRAIAYRTDPEPAAWARGTWLVTTAVLLLVGLRGSVATVAAAWELGAVPAALLLWWKLDCFPCSPRAAVWIWSHRLRRMAFPLTMTGLLDGVSSQVQTYLAAAVAGPAALGGFRAAVSVFAPMTLLGPAMTQVALPKISRTMNESVRSALRRCVWLSAALVGAVLLYGGAAMVYGRLLAVIFGPAFGRYSNLLGPLTASQVVAVLGTSVQLYLLAAQQGNALLAGTAAAVPVRLLATVILGAHLGAVGLAWALMLEGGVAVGAGLFFVVPNLRRRGQGFTAGPESSDHRALVVGSLMRDSRR
jgi:O-antigen/teichoic acid export membrane protein